MRRFMVLVVLAIMVTGASAFAQSPFVGEVDLFPYNFVPRGYAECNGALLPISTNTALFSLLGTQYGGNGTTNFALPDLRGRMVLGQGQGPGLTIRLMGENGGEEAVTLTVAQMPSHNHAAMASSTAASGISPTSNTWGTAPRVYLYSSGVPSTAMSSLAIGQVGGGQPHNNMPPYLVLQYAIALQGIFPPRQ